METCIQVQSCQGANKDIHARLALTENGICGMTNQYFFFRISALSESATNLNLLLEEYFPNHSIYPSSAATSFVPFDARIEGYEGFKYSNDNNNKYIRI